MKKNKENTAPPQPDAEREDAEQMATGQVRWYSGSRGVGVVEKADGDEVMAFLPGAAQEHLGSVQEGDTVAVAPAGPASVRQEEESGSDLFPLGLDQVMGDSEQEAG